MKYLASESTVCNLFYYFNSCHATVSIVYIVWCARTLKRPHEARKALFVHRTARWCASCVVRCYNKKLCEKFICTIIVFEWYFHAIHISALWKLRVKQFHWNCFMPESKVNLYFFSVAGRFFLGEFHLGSCACLVSIPVGAPQLAVLKCTWITFHKPQLAFDLDLKRKTVFQGGLEKGLYCH